MALERRFTDPLQVVETPIMLERIQHVSDVRKVSRAHVIREMIAAEIVGQEAAAGIEDGQDRAERVIAQREAARTAEPVAHAG